MDAFILTRNHSPRLSTCRFRVDSMGLNYLGQSQAHQHSHPHLRAISNLKLNFFILLRIMMVASFVLFSFGNLRHFTALSFFFLGSSKFLSVVLKWKDQSQLSSLSFFSFFF